MVVTKCLGSEIRVGVAHRASVIRDEKVSHENVMRTALIVYLLLSEFVLSGTKLVQSFFSCACCYFREYREHLNTRTLGALQDTWRWYELLFGLILRSYMFIARNEFAFANVLRMPRRHNNIAVSYHAFSLHLPCHGSRFVRETVLHDGENFRCPISCSMLVNRVCYQT